MCDLLWVASCLVRGCRPAAERSGRYSGAAACLGGPTELDPVVGAEVEALCDVAATAAQQLADLLPPLSNTLKVTAGRGLSVARQRPLLLRTTAMAASGGSEALRDSLLGWLTQQLTDRVVRVTAAACHERTSSLRLVVVRKASTATRRRRRQRDERNRGTEARGPGPGCRLRRSRRRDPARGPHQEAWRRARDAGQPLRGVHRTAPLAHDRNGSGDGRDEHPGAA